MHGMLKSLDPQACDLVLDFFAVDAEAEEQSQREALDLDTAFLLAQAGILAATVWKHLPHDHPAAVYANVVIGWAGMKLLTPDYWRFGRGLLLHGLEVGGSALTLEQRTTLEIAASYEPPAEGPGDRLGDTAQVLAHRASRLSIAREAGDADDWPLLEITYLVDDPVQDEASGLLLTAEALESTHGLAIGKLMLSDDGRLVYTVGVLEDPERELTPDALKAAARLAVRMGNMLAEQLVAPRA
jgi:hypothetical protein